MSRYTTGQIVERLEAMRAAAGADSDWATEVLDLVERADASDDLICKMIAGEKTGDADCDEIIGKLNEHETFGKLLDEDDLTSELGGDTPAERLRLLIDFTVAQEAKITTLHDLAASAGLIKPNDYTTDVLPLLAMFLPSED